MIAAIVCAFLIGSIPSGYVIGRVFYRVDIRRSGSGNIGAMNALRTLGRTGAAVVLILDALKGFLPTVVAVAVFRSELLGAAVAAATVLGHCFSPWLRFRGGKGVATSFGAIFGLSWPAGLVTVAAWLAAAAATQYSSVGSMFGSLVAPVALLFFTRSIPETAYGLFAAILIIVKHRENIGRLIAGTEGPIRLSRRP
jgi:acyl phosphate:glycerol-3-phosphate acyltransferase